MIKLKIHNYSIIFFIALVITIIYFVINVLCYEIYNMELPLFDKHGIYTFFILFSFFSLLMFASIKLGEVLNAE